MKPPLKLGPQPDRWHTISDGLLLPFTEGKRLGELAKKALRVSASGRPSRRRKLTHQPERKAKTTG